MKQNYDNQTATIAKFLSNGRVRVKMTSGPKTGESRVVDPQSIRKHETPEQEQERKAANAKSLFGDQETHAAATAKSLCGETKLKFQGGRPPSRGARRRGLRGGRRQAASAGSTALQFKQRCSGWGCQPESAAQRAAIL